jgi:GNAT superfamily N-acetyltransferase
MRAIAAFTQMYCDASSTANLGSASSVLEVGCGTGNYLVPMEAISHVFRLTIVAHQGFQTQGIGEALMRNLMDWVTRTARVGKIELLVSATNERAIRLYLKLGFIQEGRFRNRVRLPHSGFVDDIAMAWFLEENMIKSNLECPTTNSTDFTTRSWATALMQLDT